MSNPPIALKYYAKTICFFSAIMMVLYLFSAGFTIWRLYQPELHDPQFFTYEFVHSEAFLYGLSDDRRFVFEHIGREEFEEKKDYLFSLASEDRTQHMPRIVSRLIGYTLIFGLVFWVHRRILKRYM
ncbi:MAG: hypothetical protein H6908_01905 [Hyphomicrobiales bacterium]|nr:hypothetical protein [Rickettsiales bacterium]MCP5361387.1 hypothetical protein [Hyphomicrobiales bacterium]